MPETADIAAEIAANCLMGRTRILARTLTTLYDDEVRPFGVQASQVTTLAVIAASGPVRRREIGRWLHLDSSTLTRNLRVMLDHGWIEEVEDGEDGRGRPLRATATGAELLSRLGPAWRAAQLRAERLLGDDGRESVMRLFGRVQPEGAA